MAWVKTMTTATGEKRYRVQWHEPTGRTRRKTYKRAGDARRFAAGIEVSKTAGTYMDPSRGRITLAAFFADFMATAPLEPSSQALYRAEARLYVLPALGHRRLNTITRDDVETFVADLRRRGVGVRTIEVAYRLLRRVLSAAVRAKRIGINPATDIDVPRPEVREARFLSAEEIARAAGEVEPRYRALVLLLAYGGPRIGEACALRVKHLDLLRGRVHIAGAIKEVGGRLIEGQTKTKRVRAVVLPAFLRSELASHLAAYSDPRNPEAFVFTAPEGGPLRPNNFRKRAFYPACRSAGISPLPHVHDLRHSAVALAISAGAHPMAIKEMAGHASIATTFNVYGHLFESLQEQAAERLDGIYRAASDSSPPAGELIELAARP